MLTTILACWEDLDLGQRSVLGAHLTLKLLRSAYKFMAWTIGVVLSESIVITEQDL